MMTSCRSRRKRRQTKKHNTLFELLTDKDQEVVERVRDVKELFVTVAKVQAPRIHEVLQERHDKRVDRTGSQRKTQLICERLNFQKEISCSQKLTHDIYSPCQDQ